MCENALPVSFIVPSWSILFPVQNIRSVTGVWQRARRPVLYMSFSSAISHFSSLRELTEGTLWNKSICKLQSCVALDSMVWLMKLE